MDVQFARVRKGKGRIHLTPRVPDKGAVTTLCGKTLAAGDYAATEDASDCQACLRREQNPALVSGAFFESDAGSALLELSLAQAKARTRAPRPEVPVTRPPKAARKPAPPPEPAAPPKVAGLEARGLKALSPTQLESPAGVLIRLRETPDGWEVAEVDFEGSVHVARSGGRLKVQVGDVTIADPRGQRRP